MQRFPLRYWFILIFLVLIWGSSFALIEIALLGLSPLKLTTLRLLIGAGVLVLMVLFLPSRWPRKRSDWLRMTGVTVFGSLLPFFMLSTAQTQIDSAMTGILMAIMPLSVLLFTALLLPKEHLNTRQVLGFVMGFSGVLMLLLPQLSWPLSGTLTGQLLVLGGASCYGLATVIVRGLSDDIQPWVSSAVVVVLGSVVMLPLTVSLEGWNGWWPDNRAVLWAIAFLGALGTGLSTVVYFYLVRNTSAAFASTMNFMTPIWAMLLGTLLLDEALPSTALPALFMVLVGIGVAQGRPGRSGNL